MQNIKPLIIQSKEANASTLIWFIKYCLRTKKIVEASKITQDFVLEPITEANQKLEFLQIQAAAKALFAQNPNYEKYPDLNTKKVSFFANTTAQINTPLQYNYYVDIWKIKGLPYNMVMPPSSTYAFDTQEKMNEQVSIAYELLLDNPQYNKQIIEQSKKQPVYIYYYSTTCPACVNTLYNVIVPAYQMQRQIDPKLPTKLYILYANPQLEMYLQNPELQQLLNKITHIPVFVKVQNGKPEIDPLFKPTAPEHLYFTLFPN